MANSAMGETLQKPVKLFFGKINTYLDSAQILLEAPKGIELPLIRPRMQRRLHMEARGSQ
jgi:hypothetical protein